MAKKHIAFFSIILALALCFSLSAIAADYAKIAGIEGSSEQEANNPPESIIDGDEVTRWGSMVADDNAVFTFEKEETIESIDLMFFKAPERIHVVKVESSSDGSTWTEVAMAKTSGVMDESLQPADRADYANEGGYWDNFALSAPVTAKYFKITFLGREESGSLDTSGPMSVWEVRFILGQAPVAEAPVETVAPAVETPVAVVEAAPVAPVVKAAPVTAPKTSDGISSVIIVLAVVSSVFALVSKKRVNEK